MAINGQFGHFWPFMAIWPLDHIRQIWANVLVLVLDILLANSRWQYSSSWKYTLKVLDVHQLQRQKDWTWDLYKPIEKSYPWSIKLISKHFRNIFNPKAYQSLFQSNLSSALTTLCECWKSRHSSICISILQPSSHHCLGQKLQMLMLQERDEKEEEKLLLEQKREEKLPRSNQVKRDPPPLVPPSARWWVRWWGCPDWTPLYSWEPQGSRVLQLGKPVHNAYIEQLDSSVYNIELYTILSYLL